MAHPPPAPKVLDVEAAADLLERHVDAQLAEMLAAPSGAPLASVEVPLPPGTHPSRALGIVEDRYLRVGWSYAKVETARAMFGPRLVLRLEP